MSYYERLCTKNKSIVQFRTAMGIVSWDLQTHMPPKGLQQRSEQLGVMSKIMHQMSTDSEIEDLLELLKQDSLNDIQKREVELTRRSWNRRVKIPENLIIAEIKQRTIATSTWKKAKSTNEWKTFEPELEKLLEISKKKAEIIMESVNAKTPYDALVDVYEPKITSENITNI